MHTNGSSSTAAPDPRPSCAAGHTWIEVTGGPVPRACRDCPAVGFPCPECCSIGRLDFGGRDGPCARCSGTGTVEVVEISLAVIALTARRLDWLLTEMCRQQGGTVKELLTEIDEMIAAGIGGGAYLGKPQPGATGNPGQPRPARRKPRTGDGLPAQGRTD